MNKKAVLFTTLSMLVGYFSTSAQKIERWNLNKYKLSNDSIPAKTIDLNEDFYFPDGNDSLELRINEISGVTPPKIETFAGASLFKRTPDYAHIATYNPDGALIYELTNFSDKDGVVKGESHKYHYDAKGNCIEYKHGIFDKESGEHFTQKYVLRYNDSNELKEVIISKTPKYNQNIDDLTIKRLIKDEKTGNYVLITMKDDNVDGIADVDSKTVMILPKKIPYK